MLAILLTTLPGKLVESDGGVDDQRVLAGNGFNQRRQDTGGVACVHADVAVLELGRRVDQLLVALDMLGPDQGAQPQELVGIGEVYRIEIDTVSAGDGDGRRNWRQFAVSSEFRFQSDLRTV